MRFKRERRAVGALSGLGIGLLHQRTSVAAIARRGPGGRQASGGEAEEEYRQQVRMDFSRRRTGFDQALLREIGGGAQGCREVPASSTRCGHDHKDLGTRKIRAHLGTVIMRTPPERPLFSQSCSGCLKQILTL